MSKQTDAARYAPYVLGAAALAVGLVLATVPELTGGSGGAPAPTAGDAAVGGAVDGGPVLDGSAPTAAPPAPQRYVPDLTGQDVGELIVQSPGSAHGLVVASGSLVWLVTEGATVRAAPLAGGAARQLFTSPGDDTFGGGLAGGETMLYWSVERVDGGAETVLGLAKRDVAVDPPSPRPLITEGSPDHLQAHGDALIWSDHGVILTLLAGETEARAIVERKQLIAGLAVGAGRLSWLEVPYEHATQGGHGVMTLSLGEDDAEPRPVAPPRPGHHRELLLAVGEQLVWVEGKQDGPWSLVRMAPGAEGPAPLAQTGAVTALASDGDRLYFAELHGEGKTGVTVLRSVTLGGGQVRRLGRDSGPVPALAVHDGLLYWATSQGIKRLALGEAGAEQDRRAQ